MIYKKISESDFISEFKSYSESYANRFSMEGLRALYDYLNDYTEQTGENIELDVIALCCEYAEYESFEDLKEVYPNIKDFDDLNNYTQVIEIDNAIKTDNFIIANF